MPGRRDRRTTRLVRRLDCSLQRMYTVVARIDRAGAIRMPQFITMVFGPPPKPSDDLPCIRIQQEFVCVEPVSGFRLVGTVRTKAVNQPRTDAGQKSVKYVVARAMHPVAAQFAGPRGIENAQVDSSGVL